MYNRFVTQDEKATLRARLKVANNKIVIYLGRLEEVKGLSYLLKAFALLNANNTTLVIIGDGSLREPLTGLARELGISANVRFAGYAAPEEALNYYAIADVFVLPSVTTPNGKETWGLVVNEAMNQGVPVIATDAVGAAAGGLVQNGVNGFVVAERDSKALAEAIQRIINDDELRLEMSRNARRIIAGWDNERMVQGFQQAIAYALNKRKEDTHSSTCSTDGILHSRESRN